MKYADRLEATNTRNPILSTYQRIITSKGIHRQFHLSLRCHYCIDVVIRRQTVHGMLVQWSGISKYSAAVTFLQNKGNSNIHCHNFPTSTTSSPITTIVKSLQNYIIGLRRTRNFDKGCFEEHLFMTNSKVYIREGLLRFNVGTLMFHLSFWI